MLIPLMLISLEDSTFKKLITFAFCGVGCISFLGFIALKTRESITIFGLPF